jgi:hypothetical protein
MQVACEDQNDLSFCTASAMNEMLFYCKEGVVNTISETSYCGRGCKDGGSGKSDYCG